MDNIVPVIFFAFIGFVILFLVISWAIHYSELNENTRKILEILNEQKNSKAENDDNHKTN